MPVHNFAQPRGTIEYMTVASEALKGNMLGDPTERVVAVYLPEGYEKTSDRYPLFIDLVGFTGSGLKHLSWSVFGESVPQRIDRLVGEGKMGPVITLFPDCFTALGGNQYINSVAMGNWEDFLIDEMIPEVEKRYRVIPGRGHRALFGKSSGGYGSIVHGLKHADTWNAVACHSGDIDFNLCYLPDAPKIANALANYDYDIEKYLVHLAEKPKLIFEEMHVLMGLAMAASYDPDPNAYMGVRLPFEPKTCRIDEEAWARWLAHDPLRLVRKPECQENLRRLAGIYIDCGTKDQYNMHFGTRAFVEELKKAGIPHHYEEFDDDHSAIDYRMDESLPFLYKSLIG